MRAIVQRSFGSSDSLATVEMERPTPADDEVLVAVHCAAVNVMDWYFLRRRALGALLGFPSHKRIGRDVAGVVEAVGKNVTRFKPGDEVFGLARGAFAEYACTKERALAMKPKNATFEQAAGCGVAALTALRGIRDVGGVEPGQKVLVNGASGGIGTFAVQLAKALGAHVTAVCSGRNAAMVSAIGADRVIDYQRGDFTKDSARYDLIFDIVASHSWRARSRMLTPTGRYVLAGAPPSRAIGLLILSFVAGRKLVTFLAKVSSHALDDIRELIESGQVTPVVDRTYPLDQAWQALEYVGAGHTRGKVVIVVNQSRRFALEV
jgi:NADPH:quinone reductase-like Zn-dependent oxidoreductase